MYYGISGTQYSVTATPIKSGGEGSIYTVQGRADCLIKVYHPNLVNTELQEKLSFMYHNPPSSSVLTQIAWPIDIIFDSNRVFSGFLMNKLNVTHDLDQIYKYPATDLASVTLRHKLVIAQNICAIISEVHKAGYVFGDFNPMNIGININTGTVAFFDADTYHFRNPKTGNVYRCRAGCPGYIAPELLFSCKKFQAAHPDVKETYANAPLPTFTKDTDNFSLAIHIFKLLMNGYTPYNGIPETSPVSQASPGLGDRAIERNSYCFAPGKKPMAVAMPELSSLPPYIQEMFARAFERGYNSPSLRPSAEEWMVSLSKFSQELKACCSRRNHFYYQGASVCPYCAADRRYKSEMAMMTAKMQPSSAQSGSVRQSYVPAPSSGSQSQTVTAMPATVMQNTTNSNVQGASSHKGIVIAIVAVLCVVLGIYASSVNNRPSNASVGRGETYTAPTAEVYEDEGYYLFPSDSQYISVSDLMGCSKENVSLIRNEIYARHGYSFQTESIRNYFMQQTWYTPNPNVNATTFSASQFNDYERANVNTIIQYEKDMGWRN